MIFVFYNYHVMISVHGGEAMNTMIDQFQVTAALLTIPPTAGPASGVVRF